MYQIDLPRPRETQRSVVAIVPQIQLMPSLSDDAVLLSIPVSVMCTPTEQWHQLARELNASDCCKFKIQVNDHGRYEANDPLLTDSIKSYDVLTLVLQLSRKPPMPINTRVAEDTMATFFDVLDTHHQKVSLQEMNIGGVLQKMKNVPGIQSTAYA